MNRTDSGELVDEMYAAHGRVPDKAAYEAWHNSALISVDRARAAEVIRKLTAEEEYLPTPSRFNAVLRAGHHPPPRGCEECDDGWVTVHDDRVDPKSPTRTVRPCERCASPLYLRWASGAYGVNVSGRVP
jgi:hypothetical protein